MFNRSAPQPYIYSVERFDEQSKKWKLVTSISPSNKRSVVEAKAQEFRVQSPMPVKTRIVRE